MNWNSFAQTVLESISFHAILNGIAILILTYCATLATKKGASFLVRKFPNATVVIWEASPFVNILIYVISFIALLHYMLGFSRATITSCTASSILVLGFAFKESITSMVSGVLFLFDRPFQIGDVVSFEEVTGTVISMGLRFIQVKPQVGEVVIVPNYRCFRTSLTVLGRKEQGVIKTVDFYLPCNTDLHKISALLKQIALKNPFVATQQPILTYVKQVFNDGKTSYVIMLQCSIKEMEKEGDFQATLLADFYTSMGDLGTGSGNPGLETDKKQNTPPSLEEESQSPPSFEK